MWYHFIILFCAFLAACDSSSGVDSTQTNQDRLVDKNWKTHYYSENGIADPTVVAQEPIFQFRTDGKLYFSQINPVHRDTFSFSFLNNDNVRLTKAAVPGYYINLQIDRLTEYDFDFTSTNDQNSDISIYKTQKQ